jgi:hypothetical protein
MGASVDPIDLSNLKVNFILDMIKNYATSLISFVLSPKLVAVFAINHQLIYGQGTVYKDGIDLLEKNKNIFREIGKTILGIVIKLLLALIVRKLAKKLGEKVKDDAIEKNKSYTKQLSILNGISAAVQVMVGNLSF